MRTPEHTGLTPESSPDPGSSPEVLHDSGDNYDEDDDEEVADPIAPPELAYATTDALRRAVALAKKNSY